MSLKGCKWYSLNALGTETPLSHQVGIFPFFTISPSDTHFRYDDNCGVYWPFLPERNVPVECNSDESHTPGTFCVKIVKQGPRGFICENEEHRFR